MIRFVLAGLAFVIGVLLLPVSPPSEAMQRSAAPCPSNAIALRGSGVVEECYCSAQATQSGSVWGTEVYSDDSNICRAAVHRGVIGQNGGRVIFEVTQGLSSYAASSRNGVDSRRWGVWSGSFVFVGGGGSGGSYVARCPSNAITLRGTGQNIRCSCLNTDTQSGSVWGTGTYTDDSRICRAALHDGAIGPNGGIVIVQADPGQSSYSGSERNGVTSSNYARWHGSFSFR